jgi:predicted AAA+ superfamily ATPase
MQLPEFKREAFVQLCRRLAEPRRFLQALTGPRQVGKTTLVLQVVNDLGLPYHYVSADLPAPPGPEWVAVHWDQARRTAGQSGTCVLVLDEVQKVDRWSEVVKAHWDEDAREGRDVRVVLLGSAALMVQHGLAESLAGRFELLTLPHWSFAECEACFGWDLDRYLYFGGYPGAATLAGEEDRWAAHVRDALIETTLSRDVLMLNPVHKPALLRRMFATACAYGGQILSYQKLVGQLQDAGNTTTLAHYQRLFEAAHLLVGVPKWHGLSTPVRASSPKWLPLNTALMTAASRRSFDAWRENHEAWGRLVEVAVGAHIVNTGHHDGLAVHYWREGNDEVDFVVVRNGVLWAIEVKSGPAKDPFRGLKVFARRYPGTRTLLVGPGGVPLQEFLCRPIGATLR